MSSIDKTAFNTTTGIALTTAAACGTIGLIAAGPIGHCYVKLLSIFVFYPKP